MNRRSITFILTYLTIVKCLPIFLQGEQNHAEENLHEFSTKSTLTDHQTEDGFKSNNKNEVVNSEDKGKFDHEDTSKKHHLDENSFKKNQFENHQGGSVQDHGNKIGQKKGHHNSGFHNTYHKDEKGSESTYYDDEDGEGKHYVQDKRKEDYGNSNNLQQQKEHLDKKLYSDEDQKHGHYYKSGGYQNDYGNQEKYNRDKYNNLYEKSGKAGRDDSERSYARDYREPNYKYDYPRKIIIYEDPRYLSYDHDYSPNYQDEPFELDVRPPPRYYQDYY